MNPIPLLISVSVLYCMLIICYDHVYCYGVMVMMDECRLQVFL